jgi:hypothetical protein
MIDRHDMDTIMIDPTKGYAVGNICFVSKLVSYMMGYERSLNLVLDVYEFYKRIMVVSERPSSLKLKGISIMKHPDLSNSEFKNWVSRIYQNMDEQIKDPSCKRNDILYIREKMMEDNETWDEVIKRLKE